MIRTNLLPSDPLHCVSFVLDLSYLNFSYLRLHSDLSIMPSTRNRQIKKIHVLILISLYTEYTPLIFEPPPRQICHPFKKIAMFQVFLSLALLWRISFVQAQVLFEQALGYLKQEASVLQFFAPYCVRLYIIQYNLIPNLMSTLSDLFKNKNHKKSQLVTLSKIFETKQTMIQQVQKPVKPEKHLKTDHQAEESQQIIQETKQQKQQKLDRSIFIGNVHVDTKHKQLKKLLQKYGTVQKVWFRSIPVQRNKMGPKASFILKKFQQANNSMNAYARFETLLGAQKALALNATVFKQLTLRVTPADQKQNDYISTIFIGNLPFELREEELRQFFLNAGKIQNIRIIRNPVSHLGLGIAYIKFSTKQQMLNAIKSYNGKEFKGRNLRIKKSVQKKRLEKKKIKYEKRQQESKNPNKSAAEKRLNQKKIKQMIKQKNISEVQTQKKSKKEKNQKLPNKKPQKESQQDQQLRNEVKNQIKLLNIKHKAISK